MISPFTPPGAKIVALLSKRIYNDEIVEGRVYEVQEIGEADHYIPEFGPISVRLVGFQPVKLGPRTIWPVWPLAFFRPAELPGCLTQLLRTEKRRAPEAVS